MTGEWLFVDGWVNGDCLWMNSEWRMVVGEWRMVWMKGE